MDMKKASFFRTIVPVILILTLIFTIACDNGNENNDNIETDNGLTTPTMVSRKDAISIINSVVSGDMMYKFSYLNPETDDNGEHVNISADIVNETFDRRLMIQGRFRKYYIYNPESMDYDTVSGNLSGDDNYIYFGGKRFTALPNGDYINWGTYISNEDYEKFDNNREEYNSITPVTQCLFRINSSGDVIGRYDQPKELPEYTNINHRYVADKDGYIYVADYDNVYVLSPEYEYLFTLKIPSWHDELSLMRDNDGNVYYVYGEDNSDLSENNGMFNYVLQTIDIENQNWSNPDECKKVPALATFIHGEGAKKLMFGGGLDYYYVDKYGIIGRNEGDTTTDLLFSWLDVGLSYDEIAAMTIYSPELIFVALYNPGGEGYKYGKIELVTTESVYGKDGKPTPLKIAVDKANNPSAAVILDYAASFIRSDYGCPVEIVNYSDEGTRTANQVLLRDISSGNGPDMVVFGGGLSYEVLNKSGAFVDLYKLGGKDTDDLLPCVRKPFENDKGELNRLIFSFAIANVAGSKENVKSSMSVDDLIKLNSSLGNGQYLTYVTDLTDASKQADMLFAKLIPNTLNQYIDYDNSTVDTNGLGELMKLCKDAKVYGVEWIFVDPNLFRDGTIALDISEVYDPAQFLLNRYLNFSKEDLEYIGYPGIGTASVRPYNSLAILSSSKNQEMAWKLLSHMLDCQAERYSTCKEQDLVKGGNAFPATYSGINALFDRLSMMQFMFDGGYSKSSNGKEYYGININAFELSEEEPMKTDAIVYSDDDKVALLDILESAKVCYTTDAESIAIIEEEASYYFSGTKSLDEVLKLIKNRVETRLAE